MINKMSFVGAGSMAESIMSGILNKQVVRPDQIYVTNKEDRERLEHIKTIYDVKISSDKKGVMEDADIIILAMKPKDVTDAINSIREYVSENQLVVSVLAGISTSYVEQELNQDVAVIRAMPNTSASIGFSATAIAAGKFAKSNQMNMVRQLFETIGTTTVVDEDDLHVVTGLSGSGPAYIYYLVEAMEAAAKESGLKEEISKELIVQTLVGAAEMLKNTQASPEELRQKITSPGGTTQAGLETLERYKYQEALMECIKNAKERSIELGKPYQRV
ncbi:pyrroline-5-carboxylate reductase [Salinibacillus kushneri]|uniref:Pyrroline-5-carboxylate reductase n=1 Tax=Salinibacillus kushneri TaxID=237682 RepID=A0A1I0C4A3_9BACI|nr:pyrroline-5-carboxylate reductase [Salinibacillus kushneri]SET14175.1 pyrroline-5-carboxylate reductase [Salinibacillus kushneri]